MDSKGLDKILAGCLNNDRKSQQALYERFYGYALSVALPYSTREEDAREVVNDAFLKVFTTIDRYDSTYAFATWLRTIVIRTAINRYNSLRNKPDMIDLTECLDIPIHDGFIENIAADEVLKLVQRLPPTYRLTLNLFALEGYSHLEISDMLGISVGTSKSNLSKAKARLKQMLTNQLAKKYE